MCFQFPPLGFAIEIKVGVAALPGPSTGLGPVLGPSNLPANRVTRPRRIQVIPSSSRHVSDRTGHPPCQARADR